MDTEVKQTWQQKFLLWLVASGRSPTTAASYTGCVNRVVKRLGREPDAGLFAEYLWGLPTQQRNTVRTAWRCWAAYAAEQGVEVAAPPATGRQTARVLKAGPLDPFLHYLMKHVGFRAVDASRLRWGNVGAGKAAMRLTVDGRPTVAWQGPASWARGLRDLVFGPGARAEQSRYVFTHPGGEPWTEDEIARTFDRFDRALAKGEVKEWEPAPGEDAPGMATC